MPSLSTPTVHRYLWAQGPASGSLPDGTLLAGRYQVLKFPLVLDTEPRVPPQPMAEVPPLARPYLALSPFTVAIPRPFTQVSVPQTADELLLLEEVPLLLPPPTSSVLPSLLPSLSEAWPTASGLQQVTWLWQLARLWQPCCTQQVAGSLLDWQLIRVDAEDVRLLQLQPTTPTPDLAALGHHWRPLVATADPGIRPYLDRLTQLLMAGQASVAGLVTSLTQALEDLAAAVTVTVTLATQSDQGPTRQRNEDACYPASGTAAQVTVSAATVDKTPAPFSVVCDGIGGHQGGDVASQLAIDVITQQLQAISNRPQLSSEAITTALHQAILAANQAIVAQNDAAQRQNRDRMGTTLVLALVYGARLYIAHLGDSRAYRVRSHNCRQITLDDDVVARDMRLGLGLYQEMLQAPGSGTLVQALGMADSRYLHPTVACYPLVRESVFLLCSDGLSDFDLIERLWMTELQPVVTGDCEVATASKRLIDLANRHNGHDNVTVALLRVLPTPPRTPLLAAHLAQQATTPAPTTLASVPQIDTTLPGSVPRRRQSGGGWFLWVGLLLLIMAAIGVYLWPRLVRHAPTLLPHPADEPTPQPPGETLSPSAAPPTTPRPLPTGNEWSVGDYLQVQRLSTADTAPRLYLTEAPPTRAQATDTAAPARQLPVGSIVQVMGRQQASEEDQLWVRLRVCTVVEAATDPTLATSTSPATPDTRDRALAQPGDQGWLPQSSLLGLANQLLDISPAQQGLCTD